MIALLHTELVAQFPQALHANAVSANPRSQLLLLLVCGMQDHNKCKSPHVWTNVWLQKCSHCK